jgi:hypothetical protein
MFPLDHDDDVIYLIEQKKTGKHRRQDGRYVEFFSTKCRVDLENRIEDAIYTRDNESRRTDARTYYNGVLSVLRRKLRQVNKELTKRELTETVVRESHHKSDMKSSSRILRMSGIL